MIELKDLSKKERVVISVKSEPFFISYTEARQFSNIYATLLSSFPKRYKKEVLVVATAMIKAVRYDTDTVRFSLKKSVWVEANRIHKQKLNLTRTLFVLDKLEEEGYLTVYKGYYRNEKDKAHTCLVMSEKMSIMIDPALAKKYGTKRDSFMYLEIKSSVDKSQLNINTFRGSTKIIRAMEKYNNLIEKSGIRMLNEDTGEMVKCNVIYKRIFIDGFGLSGRYFTIGVFQTIKSYLRKYITIGNTNVTEVDFSNMFPRMLYTLEGIELEEGWDGYSIENTEWISTNPKVLRDFLKESYLSILFSDSKEKSIKSVLYVANKSRQVSVDSKVKATEVVDLIIEKNKDIAYHFFNELLWAKLQSFESRIAEYVITNFLKDDILALSWHDSFLVKKEYQHRLMSLMQQGWYDVFSTHMNVKLKIDY